MNKWAKITFTEEHAILITENLDIMTSQRPLGPLRRKMAIKNEYETLLNLTDWLITRHLEEVSSDSELSMSTENFSILTANRATWRAKHSENDLS